MSIKNLSLIISLIYILCSFACVQNTSRENKKVVEVKKIPPPVKFPLHLELPKKGVDTLKTSFFADTVLYVPLETSAKTYIRRLKQIWVNDSLILINNHTNLLLFNIKGTFIKQIGKNGKGPGEYSRIYHFDVENDTIFLSSTGRKSILKYTMDGKFCGEKQFDWAPVFFNHTNEGKLSWYYYQHGKIYLFDNLTPTDTIPVEYKVSKERYKYSISDPSFMTYFQKTHFGLQFNDYMNDTVWHIGHGIKKPAYTISMSEEFLPESKHIEFSKGDLKRWEKEAKSYSMIHILPYASKLFVFQKNWLSSKYSAIYLKSGNHAPLKRFNTSYVYDDLVGKQKLSNIFFSNSEKHLIASIDPVRLESNFENKNEKPSSSWINQMKTVDENDNNILVLIKLK